MYTLLGPLRRDPNGLGVGQRRIEPGLKRRTIMEMRCFVSHEI